MAIAETVDFQTACRKLGMSAPDFIRAVGNGSLRTVRGWVDGNLEERIMVSDLDKLTGKKDAERTEAARLLRGNKSREFQSHTATEDAGIADEVGTRELARILGTDPDAMVAFSRRRSS